MQVVQALRALKQTNGLFEVPPGIYLMGLPSLFPRSLIFVRACYKDLLSVVEQYQKEKPLVNLFYFIGSPGEMCNRDFFLKCCYLFCAGLKIST